MLEICKVVRMNCANSVAGEKISRIGPIFWRICELRQCARLFEVGRCR